MIPQKRWEAWRAAAPEVSFDTIDALMSIADQELEEAEASFRTRYRLCKVGHKKGISTNSDCWTCKSIASRETCPHDTKRNWYNPSNLPGDCRWECHCGARFSTEYPE